MAKRREPFIFFTPNQIKSFNSNGNNNKNRNNFEIYIGLCQSGWMSVSVSLSVSALSWHPFGPTRTHTNCFQLFETNR